VLVLLIPLSWLGAHLAGVHGVFVGRLLTDILAGFFGFFWVRRACHKVSTS
jgi:Na+-driven multidrug efflux pump